jgi:hypothetical protein
MVGSRDSSIGSNANAPAQTPTNGLNKKIGFYNEKSKIIGAEYMFGNAKHSHSQHPTANSQHDS